MAVVGLIPFVYASITRKKKKKRRRADRCESLATAAGTAGAARVREREQEQEQERERGKFTSRGAATYRSQSCRFAVAEHPSSADEIGVPHCRRVVNAGDNQSQSCRFALRRPSQRGELGSTVSHDNGVARGRLPPGDLPGGERLLPATSSHQNDRRVTRTVRGRGYARSNGGRPYQSQSCRFAVRPLPLGDDFDFSHDDDDGGAACTPPEDHPQRLLLPDRDSRHERGLSRSLRFSSMRVFAWVRGA